MKSKTERFSSQIFGVLRGQGVSGQKLDFHGFYMFGSPAHGEPGNGELKKVQRLLRNDASKFGPTHAFSGFSIGKSLNFVIQNNLFFPL